jgi:hypothetical protein
MEQLARRRKEKLRIVDHQKAYYFTGHTRTEKIDWISIARKIFE